MKKTILFVDDEPQVLQSLSITFQKAYDVLTTTSGHEAIDLVKRKPISVIISDQRMPHMLGHELLREVKAINPAAMRILLTGYADIEAIMASVNIGDVFRFVNKPWKNDKLRETVALAVELSEKATRLNVEHQLITSAENSDIFQGVSHSTMHILVVDTNPVHLQAISEVFINECIVHTARTAEAAFHTLKTLPIAVVITDTQIGETDGVDFLTAVREDYADVVPILLSDSKDASVAIRLINEGRVYRYLVKPFTRSLLKETVLAAMSQYQSYKKDPVVNLRRFEESILAGTQMSEASTQSFADALLKARERIRSRTSY